MLTSLFFYALKCSILMTVFYGLYLLLFRKNTDFVAKRVVLLGIIVASLSFPLLRFETQYDIPFQSDVKVSTELPNFNSLSTVKQQKTPAIEVAVTDLSENLETSNWSDYLGYLYIAGAGLLLTFFLLEISRVAYLVISGQHSQINGAKVIHHKKVKGPFSFGKWVFLPIEASYDAPTHELILLHELTHLREAHTVDLLASSAMKVMLWFNPIAFLLHREIRINHEALADRKVLQGHSMAAYGNALLQVSLNTNGSSLQHSFAIRSELSKRIRIMKYNKTKFVRTLTALGLFLAFGVALFTQSSLYGQSDTGFKPIIVKNDTRVFSYRAHRYLAERHQRVFDKLKDLHPDKNLRWDYQDSNAILEYVGEYKPFTEALYFDRLSKPDKEELKTMALNDSMRHHFTINGVNPASEQYEELVTKGIDRHINYVFIYEQTENPYSEDNHKVYRMNEVDELPEPMGGMEAFVRAIALDTQVPENVNREKLPETIDFSFVVKGGRQISELNLVSKARGNKEEKDAMYKFYGQVHNSLLKKVQGYYAWKMGIKDGKEVYVKVKVAIPTKYM